MPELEHEFSEYASALAIQRGLRDHACYQDLFRWSLSAELSYPALLAVKDALFEYQWNDHGLVLILNYQADPIAILQGEKWLTEFLELAHQRSYCRHFVFTNNYSELQVYLGDNPWKRT